MRLQRLVDFVLHIASPPRSVRTRRINNSNRELVKVFQGASDGLTGSKRYPDFGFRVFGVQHPLLKLQALMARCDPGEVAVWRVAGRASACTFEVSLSGFSISGLEVGDIHSLSSSRFRERSVLLCVDKGHQAGDLLIGKFKAWHALVRAPVAGNRADLVSVHILGNQLRAR